jgi:tripartite-type tricarboxylate transporter receptor subunit TctC
MIASTSAQGDSFQPRAVLRIEQPANATVGKIAGQKLTEERNTMKMAIRIAACTAALLAAAVSTAFAQNYPTKPVKVIVPFPAGGITDIATRLVAHKLSERLGQQFYIENIAGAGGNLGMGNAARAAGDGYTILFASSSIVVNPSLYNKIPFNVDKDFIPVTKAGGSPNSWLVNPSFPAKTMKELTELIKKEPGKHSVASPGTGTTPSLSILMLKQALNLDFVVVPFAGGGPLTQSVLGGHTPIACSAIGNYMTMIKEGKLRALAITSDKRMEAKPDIPTLNDLGIMGQEAETMTGVFAPAGTPKAIVDKLQKEIAAIVNSPDIKARLLELGIVPEGDTSEHFAAYVKAEIAKWKRVIEQGNIKKI